MSDKVYWTMKDGTKINVDDMSIEHLRNTLKMILRNIDNAITKTKLEAKKSKEIVLNGEMAQDFNETYFGEEDDYDPRDEWFPQDFL